MRTSSKPQSYPTPSAKLATMPASADTHSTPSATKRRHTQAAARLGTADSIGFDVIRVTACFMVIFLHVAAIGFHDFVPGWWASNVYDSLLRSCVPLFLMLTGALLLRKEEPLHDFFSRRFSRIVPPFLFWSFFYLGWRQLQAEDMLAWYQWPLQIMKGPTGHHLWYLYALLGVYAAIPFLRKIYLYTNLSERFAFVLLWMGASAWQLMEDHGSSTSELLNVYQLSSFSGLLGYVFLGALVVDLLPRLQARLHWFALLFIVSTVLTAVGTYALSVSAPSPDSILYSYLSPLVVLAAISLFVLLSKVGHAFTQRPQWLQQLGAASLGIYGIHVFVLESLHHKWLDGELLPWPWLSIPLFSMLVFVLSAAVILLIRRISCLRGMI